MYHITARGTGRMSIFTDDRDRRRFLQLLARTVRERSLVCHAYCEMTTHYHLVITTTDANLSSAMQDLNSRYAQWWNYRHRHVGHVFQGRFGAQIVQESTYFLTVCRYVVLNPVRAGVVGTPDEWPWSSYAATAGRRSAPAYLEVDTILQEFDRDLQSARQRYCDFVMAGVAREVSLRRGPVLGDETFIERFRRRAQTAPGSLPRHQRLQPPLTSIFAGAVTRAERCAAAATARAHRYSLMQIARHLGLFRTTVRRMLDSGG